MLLYQTYMVKNKHNLENNPYSERLGFVQQFSAYGDLDDTDKSIIAHLAFDGGLKHADFYKLAHEIIHEKRAMGALPSMRLLSSDAPSSLDRLMRQERCQVIP